jgi:hypothetical protein
MDLVQKRELIGQQPLKTRPFRFSQSILTFVFAGAGWPNSHPVQKSVTNDQCVEQHLAEVREDRSEQQKREDRM